MIIGHIPAMITMMLKHREKLNDFKNVEIRQDDERDKSNKWYKVVVLYSVCGEMLTLSLDLWKSDKTSAELTAIDYVNVVNYGRGVKILLVSVNESNA